MRLILVILALSIVNIGNTQTLSSFFSDADEFLTSYVNDSGKVNYKEIKNDSKSLNHLIHTISNMDMSSATEEEIKAFGINAYNIMVIGSVINSYPITSVRKIRGFFDTPVQIAGMMTDFNKFEKSLSPSKDPRLHMALVCAANSCPILLNEAYLPSKLENQLDKACKIAMGKTHIVKQGNNSTELSKIFEWYADDFDSAGGVIAFVNNYSNLKYMDTKKVFMAYDWSLNNEDFTINTPKPNSVTNQNDEIELSVVADKSKTKATKEQDKSMVQKKPSTYASNIPTTTTSATVTNERITSSTTKQKTRYIVSSLYDKGGFDINFFNNYYIETSKNTAKDAITNQAIFLTNYLQLIYGVNKRFNVGLDIKFRSVTGSITTENAPFKGLKYGNKGKEYAIDGAYTGYSRVGLTAIGPKVKILPFTSIPKFSIQSTVYIPMISSESNGKKGYIDWSSPTWNTQFFYDHDITSKLSLFTEIDCIIENIDGSVFRSGDGYSQISTPGTLILSYFPNNDATVYLLYNSTPKWNNSYSGDKLTSAYDPYSQYGVGFKYFLSEKLQGELIYTRFHSTAIDKTANTFNFGIRYFGSK